MSTALSTKNDAAVVAEAEKAAEDAAIDKDVHLTDDERDDDEDDHDNEEIMNDEEFKRWDEGGKSDCGYRDSFHDTLMSIGASIHKVVGEPSEKIKSAMKGVGNWFQEASYAARDFKRGEMNIAEEIKGSNEEEEEEEEEHEEGEEKLSTVAEESSKVEE
mmetsp:Transcript_17688/g.28955  ORF Transcript_17688/g.28955 Transcript_17688/m.28955 type:complete len:160 (-) Transcript_17688:437-916(-)